MAFPAKNANLYQSLKNAITGIMTTTKEERNFKSHIFITCLVIAAGFFFQISRIEWLMIILCVGLVLSLELINTSIENVVDLASNNEYHLLAKKAKDASAGAVLFASLISVTVGIIVFLPRVWELLLLLIH